MKISHKTDYALKILLDLALERTKSVINIRAIARRQDIPMKFLVQILQILKGAGFVTSKRGPLGGYFLSLPPENITLGQIVRLFEGHLAPITCVSKSCYTSCDYMKKCPFKDVWAEIRDHNTLTLDNISMQDMCERQNELVSKNILEYVI